MARDEAQLSELGAKTTNADREGLMRISLFLVTLAIFGESFAKPVLTATCETPVGNRYDQLAGTIRERHDDYSDVRPVFVLDGQKHRKLLLIWPATKPAQGMFPTQADVADIVAASTEKVTAVLVSGGVVEMFSLYPKQGVVFYTKHGGGNVPAIGPFTASFHAQCEFAY